MCSLFILSSKTVVVVLEWITEPHFVFFPLWFDSITEFSLSPYAHAEPTPHILFPCSWICWHDASVHQFLVGTLHVFACRTHHYKTTEGLFVPTAYLTPIISPPYIGQDSVALHTTRSPAHSKVVNLSACQSVFPHFYLPASPPTVQYVPLCLPACPYPYLSACHPFSLPPSFFFFFASLPASLPCGSVCLSVPFKPK